MYQPPFTTSLMDVTVVLVEPEKQGNIGQVARAIKNFGFGRLVLVAPRVKIAQVARNYSVHAVDVLEAAEIIPCPQGDEDAVVDAAREVFRKHDIVIGTSCKIFKERTLHRVPVAINDFIADMSTTESGFEGKSFAVVFGCESCGLPNAVLNEVDMLVTIPTSEAYSSLNLSHAVVIILHELAKVAKTVAPKGEISLSPRLKRDIMGGFFDDLIALTKVPAHKQQKTARAFKSMVSRSHLSSREVTLLLGVFRVAVEMLRASQGKENGD